MAIELQGPLILAGAGKMGGAILRGLIAGGLDPKSVIVQDPGPPPEMAEFLGKNNIKVVETLSNLDAPPSIIIAAVKPQVMDVVFPPLAKFAADGSVVLSIAAGRTIASFEKHLPDTVTVVRAMPNTPAAIGHGMTVCCANKAITDAQKSLCTALLETVGEVGWVESEDLIDAVTAVSGSGPAYVFWLTECLSAAGVEAGLDANLAAKLARQTVFGSGALMAQSDQAVDELRKAVTSPGGTTAAALEVLMRTPGGLGDLMSEAVAQAKKRGRELAS